MVSEQLTFVRERIAAAARRAGREPAEIALLAVTKTVAPQAIEEAVAAGQRAFGENKMQEALDKIRALESRRLEWHFIGHLQKNKVKYVPGRFALIHSVDSSGLAEKIDRVCRAAGRVQPVLLQVNVSGEASKFGLSPDGLIPVLDRVRDLPGLRLEGLMTIPPYDPDPEKSRRCFAQLRELRETVNSRFGLKLHHLSMGMSHDFEVAVEEGATWVRVGTLLFGPRPA